MGEDGRGWERSFSTKNKKGPQLFGAAPSLWSFIGIGRLALAAERLNLLEEVVALVIYEDEGGEVFYFNLPYGFHAEFGELYALNALDIVLRQDGGGTTNGTEVETAVLLASVGDGLRAVALGEHYHGATVALEEVNVGVHTSSRGRAHGAAGHAFGRLGGTGVVDGMVLDVLGQLFAAVQTLLEFGVGNVAAHNDGAVEAQAGGHGVLFKFLEHFCHGAVEVNANDFAFASLAEFFGNEGSGIIVHLLDPKTILVNFAENIAVGRTTYT